VALTKVVPNIIAVANNVTNKTVGNTTSIPSFTFDGAGVVTSASNVAISGAGITANTVANSAFQTGSVENYLNASSGGALSGRNRLINGCMRIDQRGAGANTLITASAWTLDRWNMAVSQSSKISVQQSAIAPNGFANSVVLTATSNYTVQNSDYFIFRTMVEGYNISDLNFGTANASSITLSFWVRSSLTGTYGCSLRNSSGVRAYPFTYTIVAANTWEQKFITIPGDTSGSWDSTNNRGFELIWGMGVGSNYSGPAFAWAGTGDYNSATGATNFVSTQGATWYMTGAQVEKGSSPTPFECRHVGTELALCQRYYELAGPGITGTFQNSTVVQTGWNFKVSKRATPTIALVATNMVVAQPVTPQDFTASGAALTTTNPTINGSRVIFNGISGASSGAGAIVYSDAWVSASSEL
jgi:hypothetical protein